MAITRLHTTLTGAAVAAILVAAPPAAFAHAAYKSSNPADESTVASPPARVSAEFTEPITDSSSMSVFDPCGNQVDNGDSQPSGYNMTVSMSGDRAGTYTVEFRAQSVDSHVTSGKFTFTSSGGSACPGAEPPPSSGGGESGGGSRGGSGGGAAAPEEPAAPGAASGSKAPVAAGSGDGSAGSGGNAAATGRRAPRSDGGSVREKTSAPVAFQNTGGRQPAKRPDPWDLPIGGVVLAFVLCVMIGAAGGRVYAGIVAPPRR